jgi:hypothetical protein
MVEPTERRHAGQKDRSSFRVAPMSVGSFYEEDPSPIRNRCTTIEPSPARGEGIVGTTGARGTNEVPLARNCISRCQTALRLRQGFDGLIGLPAEALAEAGRQRFAARWLSARGRRVSHFSFPQTRGSGAPRRRGVLARHPRRTMTRHAGRLRGALASLAIGTPRLSALHRGDLGPPGPRFRLRHYPPERVQRCSSQPGPSVRRAVPVPPETAVTSPRLREGRPQPRNGRVGEEVAPLAPHRPGRADFPHPVLHAGASLTLT